MSLVASLHTHGATLRWRAARMCVRTAAPSRTIPASG